MQYNDVPISIPACKSKITSKWAGDMSREMNARRLIAGKGIRLIKTPNGTRIESTAVAAKASNPDEGPYPFMCRYVDDEETCPYVGWEIYLPEGCVSIGNTCLAMNPTAKRKKFNSNGQQEGEEELFGWKRLKVNGDDTDSAQQTSSGMESRLSVTIHCKKYAGIKDVDTPVDAPRSTYFWAEATNVQATPQEKWDFGDDIGDTSSFVSGVLVVLKPDTRDKEGSGEEESYKRSYIPISKSPVVRADPTDVSGFNLWYEFEVLDQDVEIRHQRTFITDIHFSAAGTTFVGLGLELVPQDTSACYLKIDTSVSPYVGDFLFTSEDNSSGDGITEDEYILSHKKFSDIMIRLYRLLDERIVNDYRHDINTLNLYM